MTIPVFVSSTSIGVLRTRLPDRWLSTLLPSCWAVAPQPIASLLLTANSRAVVRMEADHLEAGHVAARRGGEPLAACRWASAL